MRMVLPISEIEQAAPYMDRRVLQHIGDGQTEAFEGFESFDLLAFDWYDVHSDRTKSAQMLLYLDREDLFIFCEDDAALTRARDIVAELEEEAADHQRLLYGFFLRLLRGDMDHLDQIGEGEERLLEGKLTGECLEQIVTWRRELLRLKRYYEQLDAIFDQLAVNEVHLYLHVFRQVLLFFADLGLVDFVLFVSFQVHEDGRVTFVVKVLSVLLVNHHLFHLFRWAHRGVHN